MATCRVWTGFIPQLDNLERWSSLGRSAEVTLNIEVSSFSWMWHPTREWEAKQLRACQTTTRVTFSHLGIWYRQRHPRSIRIDNRWHSRLVVLMESAHVYSMCVQFLRKCHMFPRQHRNTDMFLFSVHGNVRKVIKAFPYKREWSAIHGKRENVLQNALLFPLQNVCTIPIQL